MKKLLKDYGFNSDMQYFEMIVQSYLNGQTNQAKNQFNAMSKKYKKQFVLSSLLYWNSGLTKEQILKFFFAEI